MNFDNVPPRIQIITPTEKDTLYGGERYLINWTVNDSSGIDFQKIYYRFGQNDWNVLTFLYNNRTKFVWTVPTVKNLKNDNVSISRAP